MKKIVGLILAIVCVMGLTACRGTPVVDEILGTAGKLFPKEYVVHTHYDYDMHIPDRAVLLYNSCNAFFELPEGMDYAIAGDVFTLTHTGEMIIFTTYPGHAQIQDGEIQSVTVQKAVILPLIYRLEGEQVSFFTQSGEKVKIASSPEYVITDLAEGTFVPLSEIAHGTTLYATYNPVDGYTAEGYQIAAWFAESPR